MSEQVNHPAHYQGDNGVECIDAIQAALGTKETIAFCMGNAMKYLFRAGEKDSWKQDMKKAAWYINKALELHGQE